MSGAQASIIGGRSKRAASRDRLKGGALRLVIESSVKVKSRASQHALVLIKHLLVTFVVVFACIYKSYLINYKFYILATLNSLCDIKFAALLKDTFVQIRLQLKSTLVLIR